MARSGKDDLKTPEYRSPQRVLVRVFENSRDLWKAKYQTLQERIKEFRTEVRDCVGCATDGVPKRRHCNSRPKSCVPNCNGKPSSPPRARQRSHGVLTQLSS